MEKPKHTLVQRPGRTRLALRVVSGEAHVPVQRQLAQALSG